MRFSSPLRYPGGKGKFTNYFKLVIAENDLIGCEFVEPFAGGASVGLSLLMHNYIERVHLNDLDPNIFGFWRTVLDDTDNLCKLIADTKITIDEWHKQRAIFKNPSGHSLSEAGFSTFFLNRTCRSGVLSGGVIGGIAQNGDWKIDARFNKYDLIKRIQKVALFRSKITLYHEDAVSFIDTVSPLLPENHLCYFDPPYFDKGECLYDYSYRQLDHERLSNKIRGRQGRHWVVSYDDVPVINSLYLSAKSFRFSVGYSVNNGLRGNEVMFFSTALKIPDVDSPADVIAVA